MTDKTCSQEKGPILTRAELERLRQGLPIDKVELLVLAASLIETALALSKDNERLRGALEDAVGSCSLYPQCSVCADLNVCHKRKGLAALQGGAS